ncbi:hypothetical protein ncot_01860 [Nocardioides sp. JQ2195]|uniref:hypothetical protein n=1 Tax=Nocardioides sp. JQ2195 TaxID=2592334 RepID=UPI00143E182B|nr:hypothetical protein [Nocardioides sp. JQ2195]QIX25470.1 hypothetical protein ncot_01860 [Nocardioides sp. JQ2195]
MSRRVAIVTALLVVVAGAAAVIGYVVWPRDSDFEKAAALLPDDTLRVTWTDWGRLRDELPGPDFVNQADDRDLSVSSLASAAPELEGAVGFDPTTDAEWEILGQGREGMVVVVKVDGDLGELASGFEDAGWTRPSSDDLAGEVWSGGADVAAAAGLLTPELQFVAFDEEQGLLVGSDQPTYLDSAMEVVTGDEDGLDITPLSDGLEHDPLDVTAFLGDYACEALTMGEADEDAQAVADDLVDEAGGVTPLKGYLVALSAERRLSVVFRFADDAQAEHDASSRGALMTAEDPGQMVAYPDLVASPRTTTDGDRVVITGRVDESSAPMANLASGPVLLASC